MTKTYKKVTLNQVKAMARKQEQIFLRVFPSNCTPYNMTWVQGGQVNVFLNNEQELCYMNAHDEVAPFTKYIDHFSYYNCTHELGRRVHYYIEETEEV